MADKICHLCETHYTDDPFFTEHPGHTAEKCLSILGFRVAEAERKYYSAKDELKRAEKHYKKEV